MSTRARWTVLAAAAAILGAAAAAVGLATGRGEPAPAGAASATESGPTAASPEAAREITVYKSRTCGCCSKWVDHLEEAGFEVRALDVDDMSAVKRKNGVPAELQSCHTATVEGYVIEGHVPAEVIVRLLEERPDGVAGLAIAGMPMGTPGMEGPRVDPYEVVAFERDGGTRVYEAR